MNLLLIGNALSFAAAVIMTLMGFIKIKRRFLIAQCGMNALFIAGNLCLGGITGAIANAVTLIRNLFCLRKDLSKAAKAVFILLQIALAFIACSRSLIAWLPIIGNCVFTWYIDTKNMVLFKLIVIACQLMWAVYDFSIQNYATVPFDIATAITNTISIISIIRDSKNTGRAA